eukprot:15451368-Alexandrium_andersonii.AAC.1
MSASLVGSEMCIRDRICTNSEPPFPDRGGRRRRRASRGASGARICIVGGSELLQISSRGEGRLTRWASWDRELPGWISRPGPILTG